MSSDQKFVIPFFVIGLAALIFARPINVGMIRLAEWQLKAMKRHPWGVWYFRVLGCLFLFVAIGVFIQPAQH